MLPAPGSALHVTAVLVEPVTVAVKWTLRDPSNITCGFSGVIFTLMPPAVASRVATADTDLVWSSILVAVSVTLGFAGRLVGAV